MVNGSSALDRCCCFHSNALSSDCPHLGITPLCLPRWCSWSRRVPSPISSRLSTPTRSERTLNNAAFNNALLPWSATMLPYRGSSTTGSAAMLRLMQVHVCDDGYFFSLCLEIRVQYISRPVYMSSPVYNRCAGWKQTEDGCICHRITSKSIIAPSMVIRSLRQRAPWPCVIDSTLCRWEIVLARMVSCPTTLWSVRFWAVESDWSPTSE